MWQWSNIHKFRRACQGITDPAEIEKLYNEIFTDKRPGKDKYKRIRIDGVEYESVKVGCKAMGWDWRSLGCSKCLYAKREGDIEWLNFKGHYVEYLD